MVRIIVILAVATTCALAQPKPVRTDDAGVITEDRVFFGSDRDQSAKKAAKSQAVAAGDDAYRIKINQLQGE